MKINSILMTSLLAGLWGGEGVIKGLKARPETRHRSFVAPQAKFWWPKLFEVTV